MLLTLHKHAGDAVSRHCRIPKAAAPLSNLFNMAGVSCNLLHISTGKLDQALSRATGRSSQRRYSLVLAALSVTEIHQCTLYVEAWAGWNRFSVLRPETAKFLVH